MLRELISLTEKARGHSIAVPTSLNGNSTAKSTAVDGSN